MVFLACRRDLSSRAVTEAAWGSGDAHVQSTATRQPRPQAFWGPRCSVLDPWLRREAKPERTLGPGATVGVLGMGVPRLACLRPTAWLSQQAVRPIFINKASKTLARRTTQDLRMERPPQAASSGVEISMQVLNLMRPS